MQLEFYIDGSEPGLKGTVHVESKEVCVCRILEAIFVCCRDIEPQGKITTQINVLWVRALTWLWLFFRILKRDSMNFVLLLWILTPTQDGPSLWKTTDMRDNSGPYGLFL